MQQEIGVKSVYQQIRSPCTKDPDVRAIEDPSDLEAHMYENPTLKLVQHITSICSMLTVR